jgi:osmotically inducible protein OsmC
MDVLYTAEAHAVGGRDGRVSSSDGVIDVELKPPPELGGVGGRSANPEQPCFPGALNVVAGREKIRARDFTVDARLNFGKDGEGAYDPSVELHRGLPGVEPDNAAELVQAAHAACPFSKATRRNVEVSRFAGAQALNAPAGAGQKA